MKISVTVNLGNYENIKIESSEWDNAGDCQVEIKNTLAEFGNEPRVRDFLSRIFP